jgi:hypothetical protein
MYCTSMRKTVVSNFVKNPMPMPNGRRALIALASVGFVSPAVLPVMPLSAADVPNVQDALRNQSTPAVSQQVRVFVPVNPTSIFNKRVVANSQITIPRPSIVSPGAVSLLLTISTSKTAREGQLVVGSVTAGGQSITLRSSTSDTRSASGIASIVGAGVSLTSNVLAASVEVRVLGYFEDIAVPAGAAGAAGAVESGLRPNMSS